MEHSTLKTYELKLEANMHMHKAALDNEFPPGLPKHARLNAIFTDILMRGYHQATGLLHSIAPFYRLMLSAGLTSAQAWSSKTLTYLRAVFDRIHSVRSLSSEKNAASMLFGMMRATELLDTYGQLEWVRHPDISSAMIISALQRDMLLSEKDLKKMLKNIDDNMKGWQAQRDEIARLKKLNNNWNQ